MKTKNYKYRLSLIVVCLIILVTTNAHTQFIEDALRLDYGGLGVGSRSLAMGTAYLAISDDFTATYWNPAGLAQISNFEISGGLSNISVNNDASYIGELRNYSTSNTNLDNLGLVIPVPTVRGSMTLALGYNRVRDFSSALAFDAFNSSNSIIPTLFDPDPEYDMAFQLWLNDEDGYTPLTHNLHQEGTVIETGGINNWSIAGAVEIAKDLYTGATINLLSGNYRYTRIFNEIDRQNNYTEHPFDFDSMELEDKINADITGFNITLGILYNVNQFLHIGGTIQTPSRYTLEENFSYFGRSWFDDGDQFDYRIDDLYTDYKVSTPWKFAGGASIKFAGITIGGSLEYTDWRQLEFRDATPDVMRKNIDIRDLLEPTLTIRGGGEFIIPGTDIALRGGYFIQPSPYKEDPRSYDRTYITTGVGFKLQNMIALDFAYARGTWETHRWHYSGSPQIDENITQNSIIFTFRYSF